MITEADTCRKYVLPLLYGAGWSDDQINEQKTFTDGKEYAELLGLKSAQFLDLKSKNGFLVFGIVYVILTEALKEFFYGFFG